jgi:hypothetical protein
MTCSSFSGQARAMMQVIALGEDASSEHVDDFLGSFDVLLHRQ